MTPEQIDQSLNRLEAIPDELTARLGEIRSDETLSPAGRDRRSAETRASFAEEVEALEASLTKAIRARIGRLRVEIADEQRLYFEPLEARTDGSEGNAAVKRLLERIESHLRRADLRRRWELLSGREILSLYQELLASDDRPLIELSEAEAPRLLASRGDSEGEAALRAAISQARSMRATERLDSLTRALEKAEIQQLRFTNALANIREKLRAG